MLNKMERTCTEPCRSAGVRLPKVPCLGTSGHAATPLFVYRFSYIFKKIGEILRYDNFLHSRILQANNLTWFRIFIMQFS